RPKPIESPAQVLVGKKRWIARIVLLIGTPLFSFALLEVLLRVSGFGYSTHLFQARRIEGKNVWVQNDHFTRRFFGKNMERLPFPTVMEKPKAPGTVRIFVLGESAAYGDPQPDFGLPRMLDAFLSARYPHTHFEVINAAMTAINSHVILPAARDCVRADSDIWVIYMGNNEVVGPFGAGTVFGGQSAGMALIRGGLAVKKTRTGQLLELLFSRLSRRPDANREWGGMEMFLKNEVRADDKKMSSVYAHFGRNLQDILNLAARNHIKVALGTVAVNLKDCAPFASQHRPALTRDQLDQWQSSYNGGIGAQKAGKLAEAAALFRSAAQIDDSFADLHFAWGQTLLALGEVNQARRHFTEARDDDTLRFRADTRINEIIRQSAAGRERQGIGLVDTEGKMEQQSPNGLPGAEFFYEHVHLNFEGNYAVARAFAEQVGRLVPSLSGQPEANLSPWPTASDCAKRLGWTDSSRYEGEREILARLTEAPFVGQLNHEQEYTTVRQQLAQVARAETPEGLRSAERSCRDALSRAPEDWVLSKELAGLLERLGDYGGAVDCWRAVVKALPHHAESWQSLGRALVSQKRDDQAREAYSQALILEPDSPVALTGMAEICARRGDYAETIRYYERILRFKPYWGPAHLGLAEALEKSGRKEQAQAHFQQALQNRMYTPAALKGLATFCFERGWYKEAVTNFVAALTLDPLDASTEVNLGMTLGLLGQNKEAQQHYAQALRLDPNFAEAHVRLGFELGRGGDDAGAMDHFAKAVQLKPQLLEARLDLGIALLNQHLQAQALDQFREVLKQSPTNSIALRYVKSLEHAP
ncbi:MAG TPA: tetratricopeptide repeat protein, partial [Patescibacteria group bacterium]|nr:tetratricopeptide repeat protein [Patescibacteria group bacterium]